ncbi:MAG TPA: Ig-like domain-containing protein, partial [Myxococcaceae bacterium]|nr:Ig-like domain-containing protein [Myxococcaceae bacterium]
LQARAHAAAGNVGPFGASVAVTVDTTAPSAPSVLAPPAGSALSNPSPEVSGLAEPGARVDFFLDGQPAGTAVADGAGIWAVTPSSTWSDGPHALSAQATDAAGNVSPVSAPVAVVVDTGAPMAPTVTGPVDGSAGYLDPPTVSGSAEPDAEVEVFVDGISVGTTTATEDGSWTFNPPAPLGDGVHAFSARASDAAGNVGPISSEVRARVDTAAPAAPVVLTPSSGALLNIKKVQVSGTAEPGARVSVVIDGAEVGSEVADASGAWSVTSPRLADGSHRVTARAFDPVGNEGPTSAQTLFTVDGGAPETVLTAFPAALSRFSEAAFAFESDDAPVTYECRVDGTGAFFACEMPFSVTGLKDGEHRLEVRAVDAAGNADATPAMHVWLVDTVAPGAPTVSALSNGDQGVVFRGTTEPNATVDVFVDGVRVGTAQADAEGRWDLPTTQVSSADHQVFARATDPAGNPGADSPAFSFGVESLPRISGSFLYSGGGVGCSAAGGDGAGVLLALLGLGGVVLRRRRSA